MTQFGDILAIDTAMNACNAGVYRAEGKKRLARAEPMPSGHGERLMPLILAVMAEAGITFPQLDAIVATAGPGAFTGLRIGLAAAKALGLALGKPVFGISTTQALAAQYAAERRTAKNIAVIIETKRDDFYFQAFAAGTEAMYPPQALSAARIAGIFAREPFIVIGDGVKRFRESPEGKVAGHCVFEDYGALDAGFLAQFFGGDPGEGVFSNPAQPLYLKGADVTQSKTPQRTIAAKS